MLSRLARARNDWHRLKEPVAFSLTATTGAGKTVMAAAVIEALFNGNPEYHFDPDSSAVVLWFTDDPSLNEQTRFRLLDAADRIAHSRLVVIENTFNRQKFEQGKVYFLNAQKLAKKSLLVRAAPQPSPDSAQYDLPMPDARAFTIWDTLANTIADDHLTLYVILDEAHRGMNPPSTRDRAEKATIVQRLVNGAHGVPAVPIVWGISATVRRFNDAMERAENRTTYSHVVVDPARVQESGLLKDDIRLDFPTEAGRFDTVLLTRAVTKAKHATDLWRAYAQQEQATEEPVVPLLVVQMPNKPSDSPPPLSLRHHSGRLARTRTGRDCTRVRRTRPDRTLRLDRPPTSRLRLYRIAPTSVCSSPRMRSPPAGTAPVRRCWCRSVPPGTRPTLPSSSAAWSARRSPAGYPATTSSTPLSACCHTTTEAPQPRLRRPCSARARARR